MYEWVPACLCPVCTCVYVCLCMYACVYVCVHRRVCEGWGCGVSVGGWVSGVYGLLRSWVIRLDYLCDISCCWESQSGSTLEGAPWTQ